MILAIWLISASVQILFTGLLALSFARFKKQPPNRQVRLSVIIAAHNEIENLKVLLPALFKQDYPNFEIIVGLDRSSGSSADFLAALSDDRVKWIEIPAVPAEWNEKKYALTQAIHHASGDWLVFTDADCYPLSDQWLAELTSKTQSSDIIIGYSPYQSNNSILQRYIQYEAFVTAFHYLSMGLLNRPYMAVGRNMAIKRTFFHQHQGYEDFKSRKGGDDDLFIQKHAKTANIEVVMGRNASVKTYPKESWKDYFNQKLRHLSVGGAYRPIHQLLHTIFATSLLLTWALLPFQLAETLAPIILIYLFVKLISYRFAESKMGVGFNYILLPCVDILYAILIPVIAIRSKLKKDITWKN